MSYCINDVKVKETGVGNWVLREPWRVTQSTFTALICETIPLLARSAHWGDTQSWALYVAPTHYSC